MYKLIETYDAGGDLSKEWFVKYHFLKPDQLRKNGESNWERFKIGSTINCLHTKTERRKQMSLIKKGIKILLRNGFNPFVEFNLCNVVSYDGHSIVNLIDKYYIEVKPNVKPNTLKKYKTNLNLFKSWLASTGNSSLKIYHAKKELIHNFLKYHQTAVPWANKTYNHYLNSINTFFEYFQDNYDDLVEKNPCSKLKRLQPEKSGNRPFDNYEFRTTLEYLKKNHIPLYNFARFLYYGCLRPDAEARMVRIGDIDLESRRLTVGSNITKGKATQVVPIDDQFAAFLESLNLDQYPRHYFVFGRLGVPNERPCCEKYFAQIFRPMKKEIALHPKVTLYSLKHTRAIHMVEDGEELFNIIKFTRHRTLANLMDYLKDMGVIIGETKRFKSRAI